MAESAEATLDALMVELGDIVTQLETIFADGSDLTADEVRAKTLDLKTRLSNLVNPAP